MLLDVLSSSWLNCMEKAPTGVPFCVRNALPGEVGAGLDQVASTCILRACCSWDPGSELTQPPLPSPTSSCQVRCGFSLRSLPCKTCVPQQSRSAPRDAAAVTN